MGAPLPTTSALDRACSTQRGWAREGSKARAPPKLIANAITLTVNPTMPSVKAEVCHTHYAHEPRLGHIRLSKEVRLKIVGKLVQKF